MTAAERRARFQAAAGPVVTTISPTMKSDQAPLPDVAAVQTRRELAARLGFFTEEDVALLAGVKFETLARWRYRGLGLPFVKLGGTFLYPVALAADHLLASVQEREDGPTPPLL